MNNKKMRKPGETAIEKIFVYAFPDWISIYKTSKKIYGYNDSSINDVVKKNKKYFEFNHKGQIRSKSKFLLNDICNLTILKPDEKASLKRFLEDKNFRCVIGYIIDEGKFCSIQQIEQLLKQLALVLLEFRKTAKNPEFIKDPEIFLNQQSKPENIKNIQIVKKEMYLREPTVKWINDTTLLALHGVLVNLDQSCSKNIINKLSALPVPPILESALSIATASFIKCKI